MEVYNKYNGLCAYTGTKLKDDWQIDHIIPKIQYDIGLAKGDPDDINNLVPTQRIINHYKGGLDLDTFRSWYLGGLHTRLTKLPKNPRVEKTIKHKKYLLEVANLFGITEDKPFNGKFYFELLKD